MFPIYLRAAEASRVNQGGRSVDYRRAVRRCTVWLECCDGVTGDCFFWEGWLELDGGQLGHSGWEVLWQTDSFMLSYTTELVTERVSTETSSDQIRKIFKQIRNNRANNQTFLSWLCPRCFNGSQTDLQGKDNKNIQLSASVVQPGHLIIQDRQRSKSSLSNGVNVALDSFKSPPTVRADKLTCLRQNPRVTYRLKLLDHAKDGHWDSLQTTLEAASVNQSDTSPPAASM